MIWIYVLSGILVFVILVRIYWYLDDKKKIKNILESFKSDLSRAPNKDYSQKRLKSIYGYAKRHQNDDTLDEITFEDLDILSVYKEINYSYSSVGDEYLMYTLLNPHLDKWDISDYEKKIGLIKDGGNKDKLSLSFYLLSRTGRFSLYDYIDKLDNLEKKSNIKYIILWLIYAIIIGVIVFSPYLGLVLLFLYAIVVAGIYLYHKKDVSEYLLCFKYINKMVRCAIAVESYLPDEYGEEKARLKEDIKKLKFINGPLINILFKSNTNSVGDISGGLYDYLNMLTHLDMFIFNNLIGNVKANTGAIDEMFSILGSVESKISVINYRNRIDYYSNRDSYEGEFKNDLRDGYGIYYSCNGDRYEGGFKNNLKNGYGIEYYSDGCRYKGEFKNNLKNGYGIEYYPNGCRYEGEFKNDLRDGYGIYYFLNGCRYEGKFNNFFAYGIFYPSLGQSL